VGRSRGNWIDYRYRRWLRLGLKLETHASVARLSFAATRANAPQLLGGLIEKQVGEVGHGVFLCTTIHPVSGTEKQEK
jgi:hypothetical protein